MDNNPVPTNSTTVKMNKGLLSLDYKHRATVALDEGDVRNATYYQTESLGVSRSYTACPSLDDIIQTAMECNTNKSSCDPPPTGLVSFDDLCKRCDELPPEWTVIQIAKEYTPLATSMTHKELLKQSTPIWLTVFRSSDPCEGSPYEPILISLNAPEDKPASRYPNYFHHINAIVPEVKKTIINNTATNSAEFQPSARNLETLERLISSAIQRTCEWLGPWANLFVGNFRSSTNQQLEREVFNEVEEFCVNNRINRTGQRLISLVARRLDLLKNAQVFQLCCCDQLNLDDEKAAALYIFLFEMKWVKFMTLQEERLDCYPVMLIIDELLDGLPWEMVHPSGEYCRFANFWTLSNLYRAHAKRIKNGYLRMSAKQCYTIINPGKNLDQMSARLQMFYKEWYPSFKLLIDQAPTATEFSGALTNSDVLIYNGHGSGLQFMDGHALLQLKINCVTFLFGCDSVRLYPKGRFRGMTSTDLYYNAAGCPTVIGALWVLTDLYTDIYSILLLGNWIPSTNPLYARESVASIDMVALKACQWQLRKGEVGRNPLSKKHPSLLKLMGDCRMFSRLPQRIRCALVCRGLPVMNEACI